jgi:uncharacterized small protein (DUF1192 family)
MLARCFNAIDALYALAWATDGGAGWRSVVRRPPKKKRLVTPWPSSGRAVRRKNSGTKMSNDNSLSLSELNDRIAILRDNLRQLVEQAAGSSGAQDEERASERIAQQQEQLDGLIKQRDAMLKK